MQSYLIGKHVPPDTNLKFASRLNSFRKDWPHAVSLADAIRRVASVPGISAIELNYPQHFETDVISQARDSGLAVTALNLRWDGPDFVHGAFTHPDPRLREKAVALACSAVEKASDNHIEHVILWMGPDGFDYPFQADYSALWALEIDGFRRVAQTNPRVKVSVEYKPSDPRRLSLIRTMGEALLAVADVGAANFGVTLDVCHQLMTGEHPAAAASLALDRGKLFGLHLNDGYGPADDGMMIGSVHPWKIIELLWVIQQSRFVGTIYFDTFPDRMDAMAECAANVDMVRRMMAALAKVPNQAIGEIQQNQDGVAAMALLRDLTFGKA